MAISNNVRDLSDEVIEDYLTAAQVCIATKKANGGNLGYSAMLLLLCATDAIGHRELKKGGKKKAVKKGDKLGVLTHPDYSSYFGVNLSNQQKNTLIKNLKEWYRHLLVHRGLIAIGVYLENITEGDLFVFNSKDELVSIRVPLFYDLIKGAWEMLKKAAGNPDLDTNLRLPDPLAQAPGFLSSLSPTASGAYLSAKKPQS